MIYRLTLYKIKISQLQIYILTKEICHESAVAKSTSGNVVFEIEAIGRKIASEYCFDVVVIAWIHG